MSVAAFGAELLDWRAQLETFWEELDVPHGWRAEILEGTVVVNPPPANVHNTIAATMNRLLVLAEHEDWGVHRTQAIEFTATGEIYVPSALVYPRSRVPDTGYHIPAEHALLVVEITSPSNADHDRKRKLWGYAHGPVPLTSVHSPRTSCPLHEDTVAIPHSPESRAAGSPKTTAARRA